MRWLSEKRSRKNPPSALRLLRLPKQTRQSNVVLTLAARDPDGGKPWLTIEWTSANERLPLTAWQRNVDLDLLRFGLLARAALPYG